MSYEGYAQLLCPGGHYYTAPEPWCREDADMQCQICKKMAVWVNEVDDTNCDEVGYIDPIFLTLEHGTHDDENARYRVPSTEETETLRAHAELRSGRPRFREVCDLRVRVVAVRDLDAVLESESEPFPFLVGIQTEQQSVFQRHVGAELDVQGEVDRVYTDLAIASGNVRSVKELSKENPVAALRKWYEENDQGWGDLSPDQLAAELDRTPVK